ncbi:ATP-binding protein [Limibacter armeniacum]|uniref:ATP-binding protein n=1 Tax=Limibacter armeniacum TaxID=466084 RepID=UPI002FE6BEAD
MEGIIFIGIQASGKSTFYKERFFNSHVRISMDLLNTRNKENQFIEKCIELHQRFVVDNTNPTVEERQRYITKLKERKYKVIGYFFKSIVQDSLFRNQGRVGKEKIAEVGILSTYKKLELPSFQEGFDELYQVEIVDGMFEIKKWKDEI